MTVLIKIFKMLLITFITMLFIYPLLHELGHGFIALIVGADIYEFSIFPQAYVLCDIFNVNITGIILMFLNGIIFPFIISELISLLKFNNFEVWYVNFIIKLNCAVSYLYTIVVIFMYANNTPIPNDDMTQALNYWPEGMGFCLFLMISLSILSIWRLLKTKPIKHILEHFDFTEDELFA